VVAIVLFQLEPLRIISALKMRLPLKKLLFVEDGVEVDDIDVDETK